jgi:hypothetical protein
VRSVLSDGRRFVLLKSYSNDGSRVLDTRTGRSVAVQQPCAAVPAGATQGTFTVHCVDDIRSPAATKLSLVDSRTGQVTPVAYGNRYDVLDGALGKQWLSGYTYQPGSGSLRDEAYPWLFYNWHTGERREFPRISGAGPPVLNLDTPDLQPGATPRPVSAIRTSARALKRNIAHGDTWQVTATHRRRHARWRITNVLPEDALSPYPSWGSGEILTATTDYMVVIGVLDDVVPLPGPYFGHGGVLGRYRFYRARL